MNLKLPLNLLLAAWSGGIGFRMLLEYGKGSKFYNLVFFDAVFDWGVLTLLALLNIVIYTLDFHRGQKERMR